MKITLQLLIFCFVTVASVPHEIIYQGFLTDKNDKAVADEACQIVFNFYEDSLTGSTVLFADTQTVIPKKGFFSAIIGSTKTNGISLPFDRAYWVGIKYNNKEFTQRMKLGSSAYAMRAAVADSAVRVGSAVTTDSISVKNMTATNIGVGTAIDKAAKVSISANQSDFNVVLKNDLANSKAWYLGSSEAGKFLLGRSTTASYADLSVDSAGNVGIGTASPSAKFHISSYLPLPPEIKAVGMGEPTSFGQYGPKISLYMDSRHPEIRSVCETNIGIESWVTHPRVGLHFTTVSPGGYIDALRISGNGNVGIGTNSPIRKLQLNSGIFRISSPNPLIELNDSTLSITANISYNTSLSRPTYNAGLSFYSGSTSQPISIGTNNNDIRFVGGSYGSSEYMTIADGGNVGVGNTSPNAKLSIIAQTGLPALRVLGGSLSTGSGIMMNSYSSGIAGRLLPAVTSGANSSILTYYDNSALEIASGTSGGGVTGITMRAVYHGDSSGGIEFYTKSVKRMSIGSTGNIAMLGNSSVTGNLTVTGTINGSTYPPSDRRFKINITPISSALNKIDSLQGVFYYWNREVFPDRNFTDNKQVGLIAQDVENVLPEVVHTAVDGYKSLSYDKLTAVLIEAVKEQRCIIKKQQDENSKQSEIITSLLKRVEALEKR